MLTFSFALARLALRAMRGTAGGEEDDFSPSLDFADARNSQYTSLLF